MKKREVPILTEKQKRIFSNIEKSSDFSQEEIYNRYENVLNICFSKKPKLIKFDSNTKDEEIDRFFESL